MKIRPVTFRAACQFVDANHRHHRRPQGCKFCLSAELNGKTVGIVIVGRPVARNSDDGLTAEITRLCTDGTKNAASKLYGAARRVCAAMGYQRVITFTMESEPGTSLIAAGMKEIGTSTGNSWTRPSRSRTDKHPLGPRRKWESVLKGAA